MTIYTPEVSLEMTVSVLPEVHYAPQGILSNEGELLGGGTQRGVHLSGSLLRDTLVFNRTPDASPSTGVVRNLETGDESSFIVIDRYGTTDTFDFWINLGDTSEGDTFEIAVDVSFGGKSITVRRTYVVLWPLEETYNRVSTMLDLMQASTYLVKEGDGYVLHFVRQGTGDYETGEILLSQDLYDVSGAVITDLSTFVARAITR